jgi:hypothetical protein
MWVESKYKKIKEEMLYEYSGYQVWLRWAMLRVLKAEKLHSWQRQWKTTINRAWHNIAVKKPTYYASKLLENNVPFVKNL